jgi:branched-chain amino acid transport system ATP-binding protein
VIILDEPSLGLAPKVVGEIVAALATLRDERGLAILLVEQNVRAAFLVADRVVVMDRGSVVAEGTPADLARDDVVRRAYLGGGTTSSNAVLDVIDSKAATGSDTGSGTGTDVKEQP